MFDLKSKILVAFYSKNVKRNSWGKFVEQMSKLIETPSLVR